jgi:UDP-N-acetylmuramyl pentapeptide phosphotransferase/UDP-N-acetylglucosamine-1-phosphate transferase
MKISSIVGILLIVLGVVALTYQGITYTTHKKVVDIGPIQATKEEHKTIPLPPILGGLALVCGVALLISANKSA